MPTTPFADFRRLRSVSRISSFVGALVMLAVGMSCSAAVGALVLSAPARKAVVQEFDEGFQQVKLDFGRPSSRKTGPVKQGETVVLEVTASTTGYGVSCVGTDGSDVCRLFMDGHERVCGSNMFPIGTVLKLPGYGECVVRNTIHRKSGSRLTVYLGYDHDAARRWGVQRLPVMVIGQGLAFDERLLAALVKRSEETFPVSCRPGERRCDFAR
ncbi:hypothetical protein EPO34_01040 [Patescibacteria group bacterium]|nr:MAG: hypothetical protein EPO34_01040 [Patescibacteria group bacterium]